MPTSAPSFFAGAVLLRFVAGAGAFAPVWRAAAADDGTPTVLQLTHSTCRPSRKHRRQGFCSSHLTLDLRHPAHASEMFCRLPYLTVRSGGIAGCGARPPQTAGNAGA